ncbi:V-type ATPase [Fragilariopsis cylindrus CCMP1102]|uniref:V-type proton ATPase proteolipid subunit n=1 Tax=Fragilariopsis cylindrus CCMP1102 TaxID=635003 RepID=A0A1E7FAB2_9STRA|nr:V-type ATPase [Fragilariopsis cylindrus CCMP1102]|eukprot:OEU14783.1 V-type ATPase [Fragilariopsis cylindrus CCMP1102]
MDQSRRVLEEYYNDSNESYACPSWAPTVGFIGIACAVCFANIGGAYGTARAGQGIMAMGIRSPELLMKNIIPVVMAGVLGIYGMIVAVILNGKITPPGAGTRYATYSQFNAFCHLAAGLCCGLTSLISGIAIGISADAANSGNDNLFVATILIQVFASNIGLYGLITSLILSQQDYTCEYN